MNAGSPSPRRATPPNAPRALVPRPDEDAAGSSRRLDDAVAALERVSAQLQRTQRTLDAFVTQITGTHAGADMRPAPEPPRSTPEPARSTSDAATAGPGGARAGALVAGGRRSTSTAPAAPAASSGPAGALSSPPGAIAGHVLPGRHPAPPAVEDAAEVPDPPAPGRRTADSPPRRWAAARDLGDGPRSAGPA